MMVILLVLTFSMALSTNLVAYYKLEDLSDSSGNAHTLTNTGLVIFDAGFINNGADFGTNNTAKRLSVASDLVAGNVELTISGWVKLNTEITSGIYDFIMQSSTNGTANYFGLRYIFNGGTPQICLNTGFTSFANYTITLGTSNWYFLAATRDTSNNLVLYVNGVQQGAATSTAQSVGTNVFYIGAQNNGSVNNFSSAKIDEVGVWSRVLGGSEINQLYNNGFGLQYPFNIPSPSFLFKMI